MLEVNLFSIFILFISFICCYTIGSFILWGMNRHQSHSSFYDVFVKVLIGLLSVVIVYSAIKTRGNTIHIGLIVVAIFYWFQFKPTKVINARKPLFIPYIVKNTKTLLLLFVISLLWYSFYAYWFYSGKHYAILHFDEVYYSFVSSKIGMFGIEGSAPFYKNCTAGAQPYHYVELWLTYMVSTLCKINPLLVISVILKSFFTGLLVMGMFALTNLYTKHIRMYIIAFFSILFGAIVLDYSPALQMAINAHQVKMLLVAMFFVWFVILVIKKEAYWFYPLLMLPFINIATLPVIACVLCIYALFIWFRNHKQKAIKILISTLGVSLFIALFYAFQSKSETAYIELTYSDWKERFLPYYTFNFFIHDTIRYIKHYILYIPYFLPLGFICIYYRKANKNNFCIELWEKYKFLIVFFFVSVVCGYILSFIFYPLIRYDNMQLISLTSTALLNIFVFLSFLIAYTKAPHIKHMKNVLYICMLLCVFYNVFVFYSTKKHLVFYPEQTRDSAYITNVSNYFTTNNFSVYGARIQDTSEFTIIDKVSMRNELMSGYWFIPFSTSVNFLYTTSLNTTYIIQADTIKHITKPDERMNYFWQKNQTENLAQAPFSVFSYKYQAEHGHTHIDTLQFKFVKKYNIDYLVLSKQAELPTVFNPYIDTVFADKMTGERFVFLKKIQ